MARELSPSSYDVTLMKCAFLFIITQTVSIFGVSVRLPVAGLAS